MTSQGVGDSVMPFVMDIAVKMSVVILRFPRDANNNSQQKERQM